MKIRKFFESNTIDDINDFLVDFKDEGFEVKSEYFQGKVIVSAEYTGELNRVEFLENILNLISRIESIGYKSINDKLHVYTGDVDGKSRCSFKMRFEEPNVDLDKNVNSFEEFKNYLEKGLDLEFYEWDTEVYIPDLGNIGYTTRYQKSKILLKLDVNKTVSSSGNIPAGFTIGFERGSLNDIENSIDRKELSELVMTSDEYYSVNLWSVPEREKENYSDPELIKRARSKQFLFDKRGIEVVERCLQAFKR